MGDSTKRWATFCAGVVLVGLLLACAGRPQAPIKPEAPIKTGNLKGDYPPPTTKLHGDTADQWGERAKDVAYNVCLNATSALAALKKEGIPYLIVAAESQAERPENCGWCLHRIDPALVADEDLGRIADFLHENFAKSDGANMSVRTSALHLLGRAGPRAKPYLERIRKLKSVPALKGYCEGAEKLINK